MDTETTTNRREGSLAFDYLENPERFEDVVRTVVATAKTPEDAHSALRKVQMIQTVYAVDEDENNKNIWYVIIMFPPDDATIMIRCERNQTEQKE